MRYNFWGVGGREANEEVRGEAGRGVSPRQSDPRPTSEQITMTRSLVVMEVLLYGYILMVAEIIALAGV